MSAREGQCTEPAVCPRGQLNVPRLISGLSAESNTDHWKLRFLQNVCLDSEVSVEAELIRQWDDDNVPALPQDLRCGTDRENLYLTSDVLGDSVLEC